MSSLPDAKQWEALRREARRLENEIDERLSTYAKHGANLNAVSIAAKSSASEGSSSSSNLGATPSMSMRDMEQIAIARANDIDDLLNRLSDVNDGMSRCVASSNPSSSTSMMHMLQRHREILYDYTQEFKKTKANINMYREHAELLSSPSSLSREDSYKQSSSMDSLLRERTTISSVDRIAGDIIGQAMATRDSLTAQRDFLNNAVTKIGGIVSRFPVINNLMTSIGRKKKKDMMVLSAVIACCILIVIIYKSA
mmetsp:Transcript_23110/g.38017  ORF Transcript_23110/g.38017 Transcript_23110/m.38017 type:complete len:254 (-) Transcript_23110:96-857(-)|eukprot:CAMPEP_0184650546 /NCGR_PEP_ID=MMETSP0308-20130426/8085_1 /TAXON_ID=38269 /ORGANISM="Gloeochaete witrockiana, Strain SAG 46.84" /LENGTH=253 /DNA_ID=CAMNT_0027084145 /DNA_START=204 /DNA_END=965 /DNA_ORIENTATION=-